jgi:dihydroorotate dehydrogenase subfamily 1
MLEDRLRINGKLPKSRIVTASGCRATTLETIELYSRIIPDIGIFTTKSIGPVPNPGNNAPIYCSDPAVCPEARRNAVGLANPGKEYFLHELQALRQKSPDLNGALILGSVYGANLEEIVCVSKSLAPHLDAIEINFSCPHAKGYGLDTGRDADAIAKIVHEVYAATGKDVFAKLSPNIPDDDLVEIAKGCIAVGAKGITVVNTVGPGESCFDGTNVPILFNGKGGLSGPSIRQRGIDCVNLVRKAIGPEPPIIGMGGIYAGADARQYLAAGADFIGIGTVMEGINSVKLAYYVRELNGDIESGSDNAGVLLTDHVDLAYTRLTIQKIEECSSTLRIIYFDKPFPAKPCQYLFLAVPGDGEHPTMEAPLSIPISEPALVLAVRLHPRGDRKHHFTSRVWEKGVGDALYARGPYGVPFNVGRGEYYLVAGGTGAAALLSISDVHHNNFVFLGAKNEDELIFRNLFNGIKIFATEEESGADEIGFVTRAFENSLYCKSNYLTEVVACGPIPMLKDLVRVTTKMGFDDSKVHIIMEPYMKCGVGICGCCAFEDGSVSCVDGHIITADKFKMFYKSGKLKRGAAGGWNP